MLVQSKEILGRRGIREGSWRVGEMVDVNVVMRRLFGLLLKESDQVVTVLGLLETTKGHLGARNVLLGVLEVLELCCVSIDYPVAFLSSCGVTYKSVVVPLDTLLLVGVGV
jgi:hypothetical protein